MTRTVEKINEELENLEQLRAEGLITMDAYLDKAGALQEELEGTGNNIKLEGMTPFQRSKRSGELK